MIQTGDPLGDGTGGESIWGGELLNAGGREGGREGLGFLLLPAPLCVLGVDLPSSTCQENSKTTPV